MDTVKYLMGAYFHQDWVLDGGSSSDTVASFLDERRDLVVTTVEEMDEFLGEDWPEGTLAARLDEWGCQYYVGDTDDAYRAWLNEIRDQMHSFLSTNASS
jgi:hypothetical protein